MKKLFTLAALILISAHVFAEAPMSTSIKKPSVKCPQMLKGYENAKKLTIPEEQKTKMIESLKKNGCMK